MQGQGHFKKMEVLVSTEDLGSLSHAALYSNNRNKTSGTLLGWTGLEDASSCAERGSMVSFEIGR